MADIRRMEVGDLPRVMQIESECFPVPWSENAYLTEITNQSAYYVVACVDANIVGFAGMWIIMDEAHITTLGVARNARRRGTGELLLRALIDETLQRGGKRATLEVRQSNHPAQQLYESYGFTFAAIRQGYYTDNDENAVVMWANDLVSPTFQQRYAQLNVLLARKMKRIEEMC